MSPDRAIFERPYRQFFEQKYSNYLSSVWASLKTSTFQVATFGNFGETYGLTGLKRFLRRCSTFSRGSLFTINQKLKTQTYLVKMNMHVACDQIESVACLLINSAT